jgi:hypothetical protein
MGKKSSQEMTRVTKDSGMMNFENFWARNREEENGRFINFGVTELM